MKVLDDTAIDEALNHTEFDPEWFRNTNHIIIGTENGKGAVGVEIEDNHVWVTFLYGDGGIGTHKNLADIGYWLYTFYTIGKNKPVYYTGKTNLYRNNSILVHENIWQLVPKRYLRYNER